jgi:L-asparagine transporter-like permease
MSNPTSDTSDSWHRRRVGIPIAAYAYCGVEIVAVTAVEAKNPRSSLRFPAQWIAYITSAIYLVSVITFILNVSWADIDLPALVDRKLTTFVPPPVNNSTAILIIAILSAANTALYGKSRVRLPSYSIGISPEHWLQCSSVIEDALWLSKGVAFRSLVAPCRNHPPEKQSSGLGSSCINLCLLLDPFPSLGWTL